MISFQQSSDPTKKYRKQSTEQKSHNRLWTEWIAMDFVALAVMSHKAFNNLISKANPRIDQISNDTVRRELKKLLVEANEIYLTTLSGIDFVCASTEV